MGGGGGGGGRKQLKKEEEENGAEFQGESTQMNQLVRTFWVISL